MCGCWNSTVKVEERRMRDNTSRSLMRKVQEIDWLECPEIEAIPGRCGGRPTIKGTRIEPELLVVELQLGRTPEQTHDDFPWLPVKTIRAIQAFAANATQQHLVS